MANAPVLFFTGLSGSGKSTIASELSVRLNANGYSNIVLDGDVLRLGLCKDLGFSKEDRAENIRRVAEVSKLFSKSGMIVIVSFIAPYKDDRENARDIIGESYKEIYIDCPINVCKNRDPKGLYKKVEEGLIKNFTGIDDAYEIPENPDLTLKTVEKDLDECVEDLLKLLK